MKTEFKSIVSILYLSAALPFSGFCDENTETSLEHIKVSSRKMSEEAQEIAHMPREEIAHEVEEVSIEESKAQSFSEKSAKATRKKNCFFSCNSFKKKQHWVVKANADYTVLELEDGSNWKIPENNYVKNWKVGDAIEITPNNSFFSNYQYYIVNRSSGSYISADLVVGPLVKGQYTHWVVGFDPVRKHVYLENGTGWKISESDLCILADWEVNDTVIIGKNDSWFSSYDTILINVNLNNYIRARTY